MASTQGRVKRALRKRDGDRCHYCGQTMLFDGGTSEISVSVEHLKRVAEGGDSKLRNLVLAHRGCNRVRGLIYEESRMTYKTMKGKRPDPNLRNLLK